MQLSNPDQGQSNRPDYERQFAVTPLARLAPLATGQPTWLDDSVVESELLQREDIRSARKARPKRHELYIMQYRTTPLSYEAFWDLIDTPVSIAELLWRQHRKSYYSTKFLEIKAEKPAHVQYAEFAVPYFAKETFEMEASRAYDYVLTDEWVNALLALRLLTDPQLRAQIPDVAALSHYAQINDLAFNADALLKGFAKVSQTKVLADLLKKGILKDEQWEQYGAELMSWCTDLALSASFASGKLHFSYPYPLGITSKLPDRQLDPGEFPPVDFLPDIAMGYAQYMDEIPYRMREGQVVHVDTLLARTGDLYVFIRNVLHEYVLGKGIDLGPQGTRNLPRIRDPNQIVSQLDAGFRQPVQQLIQKLREQGDVTVADDVTAIAELSWIILTENIAPTLARYRAHPQILHKGLSEPSQGGVLQYHRRYDEIIRKGGDSARARNAMQHRIIGDIRRRY